MQNKIQFYWNIGSQPCRAVKALLDLGKIEYDIYFIDLSTSQTRTPQYLEKNPLGQIPFIIHGEEIKLG